MTKFSAVLIIIGICIVLIYLLGIGACYDKKVWINECECTTTEIHPFVFFGPEGGLSGFFTIIWLLNFFWVVTGVLARIGNQEVDLMIPTVSIIALTLLVGLCVSLGDGTFGFYSLGQTP